MKKRILHLLTSRSYSGAENVAIKIIESLSNEYEFIYASPKGSIEKVLKSKGINYLPINGLSPRDIRSLLKDWEPDIVHAHDFKASVSSALSFYPSIKISHLHHNPPWIRRINVNSLGYLFTSIFFDKTVVVSPSIINEAIFGKFIERKTTILPNSVDLVSVLNSSIAEKYNNEKYDIVFLGRLTEPKDPLRFIHLMNKLLKHNPNLKAVMVGDGDLKSECLSLIQALNLQHNIKLEGFLSNPFPVLKSAKLLVMTSKWEGFGLVAVEAMSLGKPVFATPVGGLKKIVNDTCGALCESDEDFIAKILFALEDQAHYRDLCENAVENAKIYGNQEKWVLTVRDLYEKYNRY